MSDIKDNKPENAESTGKGSFISEFFQAHKVDIAIYLSAIAIVASVIVYGAVVSENNKESEIHYRYNDSDNSNETDAVEAMASAADEGSKGENAKPDKSSGSKTTTKKTTTTATKKPAKEPSVSHTEFPVDINLVTFDQLLEINGVGEVTAESIISYRNSVGVIHDIAQLIEINGIGESRVQMLREYLYVSAVDYIPYDNGNHGGGTPAGFGNSEGDKQTDPDTPDSQPAPDVSDSSADEPHYPAEPEPDEPQYSYVNINEADADELVRCLLITEEQAEAIIALREQISYYSSVEELILTDALTASEINAFREYILFE